ncbi:hypothetical protein DCE93_12525 [Agromyces badenianii]|uniref:Type I restriction modification DNA specificity domain-containing protein n=1 Tax=Agromyces badenianii TaxID=2080742 RepID=A0A2S0WYJ3_9MICO|nr:restriction endonuclease subunit S [Agromyces badenianii]AWB96371.1 hypothetical protein DCE93_12525 [Agromyces badenianii]
MRTVELGDVATIDREGVDPGSVAPDTVYIGLEHIERGGRIIGHDTVGGARPTSTKFRFTSEHVLFGKLRPNLGKVSRPTFAGVCSTDILPIRPGRDLDRGYLARYLAQPSMVDFAASRTSGANLPRLSPTELVKFPVPLPPLHEQRRIAAILDQADAIRAKHRQVLSHLDYLTQAIFRDMFGDPVLNNRGLPQKTIGALTQVMTGNSPLRADSSNFGHDIEWIKSDNLGGDLPTRASEGLSLVGRKRGRVAPAGSILVTCIAGSPGSIGKASLTDRDVAFNQQINAILPTPRVNTAFLLGQLKTAPELIRAKSTGGMKGLVSKSAFKSVTVLAPPIELQRRYADRVGAVIRQRAAVQRALAADEALFASLESRVFRGEV